MRLLKQGSMKLLISTIWKKLRCNKLRQNKFHNLINKNMTVKYVHVMKNNKFIKPFVDFLNRNFDSNEHMIMISENPNFAAPIPEGNNVYEYFDLNKINFKKSNIKKIIWHALFSSHSVEFLYINKDLLEKSYWLIYGGDLYNAPRDEKNDFVRKNFKAYISDTDGDCEVAKEKYHSNPKTYNAAYTFPITSEMISSCRKDAHDFVKIQINNSCDFSTLEMLDTLSKFKNENIKITTILAYGQMQFKDEIIKKGKEIFADNFSYLDNLLSPKEYAQLLSQNDILVLNQPRQQGLGNSFATLALGKKLFIKSDVTTYNHFNSRGIKVYDTYQIANMNFDDFILYDNVTKQSNVEKVAVFFTDDYLKSLWAKIFEED